MSIASQNTTILGIIFEAQQYAHEYAVMQAWQIWMERLDPAELHGSAIYEGLLYFADGTTVIILVVSGSPASIHYVRDAFSAPDIAAFPGLLPMSQRFIPNTLLPREQLTLIGYITKEGFFKVEVERPYLADLAQLAGWSISTVPKQAQQALQTVQSRSTADIAIESTRQLQSVQLDGATQYMLRLWKTSYRHTTKHHSKQRTVIIILISLAVVFLTLGILAFSMLSRTKATNNAPTFSISEQPVRIPCDGNRYTQFIITNTSSTSLVWSNNGIALPSDIIMNPQQGIIPPHSSQIVILSNRSLIVNADGLQTTQTARHYTIQIQTQTQTAPVDIVYGGCPAR